MKTNSKDLMNLVQKELKPIYIFFAEESIQLSSLTDKILLAAKNPVKVSQLKMTV